MLSAIAFFKGKTSDLNLSSLQNGLKKSLKENYASPTAKVASESALTFSSQSWRYARTSFVESNSLNCVGSCLPNKKTCFWLNLQWGCCGISLVLNWLLSINSNLANIGLNLVSSFQSFHQRFTLSIVSLDFIRSLSISINRYCLLIHSTLSRVTIKVRTVCIYLCVYRVYFCFMYSLTHSLIHSTLSRVTIKFSHSHTTIKSHSHTHVITSSPS